MKHEMDLQIFFHIIWINGI